MTYYRFILQFMYEAVLNSGENILLISSLSLMFIYYKTHNTQSQLNILMYIKLSTYVILLKKLLGSTPIIISFYIENYFQVKYFDLPLSHKIYVFLLRVCYLPVRGGLYRYFHLFLHWPMGPRVLQIFYYILHDDPPPPLRYQKYLKTIMFWWAGSFSTSSNFYVWKTQLEFIFNYCYSIWFVLCKNQYWHYLVFGNSVIVCFFFISVMATCRLNPV